jgi:hypothetical protein
LEAARMVPIRPGIDQQFLVEGFIELNDLFSAFAPEFQCFRPPGDCRRVVFGLPVVLCAFKSDDHAA